MAILIADTSIQHEPSKVLFGNKCAKCHGEDGSKAVLGAKNLQFSKMVDSAIIQTIENGGKKMPSFKKKLTPDEVKMLAAYVKNLRK